MNRSPNRWTARIAVVPLCLALAAVLALEFWPETRERRVTPASQPLQGVVLLGVAEGGATPDVYRQYQVELTQGRILLVQKFKIRGPYDHAMELPHRLGAEMRDCGHSPLLPSPDSRYTALCFQRTAEKPTRFSTQIFNNDFEVVDAASQRKALTERLPDDRSIAGMFWSPDSRALAVLSTSRRTGLGLLDLLSAVTGHPVPELTIYLDTYDIQSRRHAEFLVRRDAEYGSARILDWQ